MGTDKKFIFSEKITALNMQLTVADFIFSKDYLYPMLRIG